MSALPTLKGIAHAATFDHLYGPLGEYRDRRPSFMRFLFMAKSSVPMIRRFLHNMTLRPNTHDYCIEPEKRDPTFSGLYVSDETLIAILELVQPRDFRLVIGTDLDRFNPIEPYILGLNKLQLETSDREILPFVRQIHEQLVELECPLDLLKHPEFPQMNLDKFKLRYSYQAGPVSFQHLLRHNIKTLDLSDLDRQALTHSRLTPTNIGECSIQRLILNIRDLEISKYILPFLEKFHQHLPALKEVELTIAAAHLLDGETIVNQLITICEDIFSLKEHTEGFLEKLDVRFVGDAYVLEDRDGMPDWDVLKEHEIFKTASFDEEDHAEIVKLDLQNGILSLHLEAELSIMDEYAYQQVLDDNLGGGIDELVYEDDDANEHYETDPEYDDYYGDSGEDY